MRAFITIATRVDRGAIAVVRIWGPDAIHVADSVFRPHRGGPLRDTPPGRLRYGRAGPGRGDEVVAVLIEGPQPIGRDPRPRGDRGDRIRGPRLAGCRGCPRRMTMAETSWTRRAIASEHRRWRTLHPPRRSGPPRSCWIKLEAP